MSSNEEDKDLQIQIKVGKNSPPVRNTQKRGKTGETVLSSNHRWTQYDKGNNTWTQRDRMRAFDNKLHKNQTRADIKYTGNREGTQGESDSRTNRAG